MLSSLFSKTAKMEWNHLSSIDQLSEIEQLSKQKPVAIFKHSTRCSISAMVLSRFERSYESESAFEPYFLDLIAFRDVSNEIASRYQVDHQSPQVILIQDGKAIFDASHNGISYEELKNLTKN